jgi:hypothetical protein
VEEFEQLSPGGSISAYYRACYSQYVWDYEDAYEAAERAYRCARSARRRRDALLLLANLLIDRVFTPEILQTSQTAPPADDAVQLRFRSVVVELRAFWPDHDHTKFLAVFDAGLHADEDYWNEVVTDVEERLGPPEEFWSRASENAILPEADELFEPALGDLTNANVWQAISRAMRWASQRDGFPSALRERLATAAYRCSDAALQWNRGIGRFPLNVDFGVAVGILLAVQASKDGRILGREESPYSSNRGRPHTWRSAGTAHIDAVAQKATGAFKKHVQELRARFRDLGVIESKKRSGKP